MAESKTLELSEDRLRIRSKVDPEKWPLEDAIPLQVPQSTLHADVPEFIPGQLHADVPEFIPGQLYTAHAAEGNTQ